MKNKNMSIISLAIASMSAQNFNNYIFDDFDYVEGEKKHNFKLKKPDNPTFSPDEISHMKTLSGKAKKIYVQELREKYKHDNESQNGN